MRALDPIACAQAMERAARRRRFRPNGDCIEWTGAKFRTGYGSISVSGVTRLVHRVAIVASRGEDIPAGLEVDHLCRNRPCLNLAHLDLVDPATNKARSGNRGAAIYLAATTGGICSRGHIAWTEDYPSGICRECRRQSLRDAGELRTAAARALGLTQREYADQHGYRLETARALLAALQKAAS